MTIASEALPVSAISSDSDARALALDPHRSFIVEAPAGSGKTGLIVQRFLKLLLDDELDGPEDVLAITFTRKATAELLERVLSELQKAKAQPEPDPTDARFLRETRALAVDVLRRDEERSWRILANPNRLNIRSIDSVCAAISNAVPVLSGSGGQRKLLQDAQPLYALAARRTLLRLGGEDERLDHALRTVLLHRDGNLANTETLLASMLLTREQWAELVPLDASSLTDERLDAEVRPLLEASLEAIVCAGLSHALRVMPDSALRELSALAHQYSRDPGYQEKPNPLALCATLPEPPAARAEALEHWRALIDLVLKPSNNEWRSGFNHNHIGVKLPKDAVSQLKTLIAEMNSERLRQALVAVRALPPARYPEDQWRVAKALFVILRHALAELKVLFAERSECDFAELSLAAREALTAEPTLADVALSAGGRLRHLLVDEMQDTSAAQYELLESLTRSWDGHTQTLFLVGDPKQSIYLFRQARVERFLRVVREQHLGELPLTALQLTANFRSQEELVVRFNDTFRILFPPPDDDALRSPGASDVPFVEASPVRETTIPKGLRWHVTVRELDPVTQRKQPTAGYAAAEAQTVSRLVLDAYARAAAAETRRPKVAVLARTRALLTPIAAQLTAAGIAYRAVEVEPLAERQEVLDALALTRTLLHPADRIAWLAVLHAPWCGLSLADLLALTGEGPEADRDATVAELVRTRSAFLSPDGRTLLARAWPVLETAVAILGQTSIATHVERTWRSLGGDAPLGPDTLANAQRFFSLLRELEALGGGRVDVSTLTARLATLYAAPSGTDADVQLMTIHKAKGLEWDIVLIPGLERKPQGDRESFLNWIELDSAASDRAEIILAPITGRGEESSELNAWLRAVKTQRERAEAKRVFYVACTRAREELHLFAMLDKTKTGGFANPQPGSLLQACFPAAQAEFARELSAGRPEELNDQLRHSLDFLDELAEEPSLSSSTGLTLVASAAPEQTDPVGESLVEELAARPPHLHRLPLSFDPRARFRQPATLAYTPGESITNASAVERPEGSFAARAFGNVVHRFLELLANRLAAGATLESLTVEVAEWQPRLATSLRGEGLPPALALRESARVLTALQRTLASPIGQWLLTPHPAAASESSLTTAAGTLRADRTFFAGGEPLSTGESHLWIVDFKTTEQGARSDEAFREQELTKYQAQLETYALLRRNAGHQGEIRLALFYPLVSTLLTW